MPELILLCAAAAVDRAADLADEPAAALEPAAVRRALAGGAFARLFARGRCSRDVHEGALLPRELPEEAWLRARHAVPHEDSIEAYSARAHGVALPCWRLTPSHVQIALDHARLVDPDAFTFTAQESRELAATAVPLFAEEGLTLEAPSPRAWFLRGERGLALQAHSWTMAAGRDVNAYLPGGPDARRWRRLLTEVQMAWFAHPVNAAREARGEPAINMLWLDGCASGVLAASDPAGAGPPVMVSRSPTLAGLAQQLGGVPVDPGDALPGAAALRSLARGADLVVDVGGWAGARRRGESTGWMHAWLRFERWLDSGGLARGVPAGFTTVRAVLTGERRCVELVASRGDGWRAWRRTDPVARVL